MATITPTSPDGSGRTGWILELSSASSSGRQIDEILPMPWRCPGQRIPLGALARLTRRRGLGG